MYILLATICALFFGGALACACVNLFSNKAEKKIKVGTWQEKRHAEHDSEPAQRQTSGPKTCRQERALGAQNAGSVHN